MKITHDTFSGWTPTSIEYLLLCAFCPCDEPSVCELCHGKQKHTIIQRIISESGEPNFRSFICNVISEICEISNLNELLVAENGVLKDKLEALECQKLHAGN